MTNLVRFDEKYLDNTFAWMQDISIKDSFLLNKEITPESHLLWYERLKQDSTQQLFSIIHKGTHCGNIGLKNINLSNKNAEMWVYIGDKALWGRGIAKDATILLLDYCFETLQLHKVYLSVADFNERAISVYRKCGFEIEGFLRDETLYKGRYVSLHRMGIIRNINY